MRTEDTIDTEVENEKDVQSKIRNTVTKAKKKPKKEKDGEGAVNNNIEMNPTMDDAGTNTGMRTEGKDDTVVIGYGRMNPITVGHEKLVKKVTSVASSKGATPQVYLTRSQDPKKNPLDYNDKIAYAKKAFGNKIVAKSNARTIIEVMKELQGKYGKVVLVVGSDRVNEFNTLLNKYNGKDYTFDSIEIVSAGDRDPDANDVSGMSASKMRMLAAAGKPDEFKKGLPRKLQRDADKIYNAVRDGMKLAEELEALGLLDEAVLTLQQRRQRALTMRKFKNKIKLARQKSMRKAATMEKLKNRARKKAINIIRAKVAGKKGANYNQLSPGEKMMIDKRVAKKKAVINKIAKRMIPTLRKLDLQRLSGKKVNEEFESMLSLDEQFELMFEVAQDKDIEDRKGTQPAKYYTGMAKSTKAKRDAQFKKQAKMDDDNPDAYKPAPGDAEAETKPSTYTKRYHQMFNKEGQILLDKRFRAFRHLRQQQEQTELEKVRDDHKDEREAQKRRHRDEVIDAKKRDLDRQKTAEQVDVKDDHELLEWIDAIANEIHDSIDLEEAKSDNALKTKSEKSGISLSILKKVFDRGVAAWRTGHRPGTTPQQWGYARVNSFITGGKTRTTGDADLWKQHKGKSEAVSPAQQAAIAIAKQKSGKYDKEGKRLDEKLKVSDGVAKWISDFQKSDAPQFAGKSDEKIRQMAIAAFIDAKQSLEEEPKYPHDMFHPDTGEKVIAKTPADHEKLAKKGYTHDDPKLSISEKDPCWDGYKQIGMKKGKDGSPVPNCVKEDWDAMFEKALEHGTDRATNKYKKDTPGQ
jgi:nicotinic acid mononucleotide adenylyltransferase